MLALTAVVGDRAIRLDNGKTYLLLSLPASTLENWAESDTYGIADHSITLAKLNSLIRGKFNSNAQLLPEGASFVSPGKNLWNPDQNIYYQWSFMGRWVGSF